MVNIQTAIIIVAVAAGAAIGGALFLLYPDMMFQGTSLSGQGGAVSPDGTTTAGSPDASAGGGYVAPMP